MTTVEESSEPEAATSGGAASSEEASAIPSEKRNRWLTFLNSPFGLFLLSSVVIAGLGRLYSDYEAHLSDLKERRNALSELVTEMEYRVTEADFFARDVEGVQHLTEYNSCVMLWRIVVGDREYRPAVPSMREVHWLGLVSRGKTLTGLTSRDPEAAILKLQFDTDGGRCSRPMRPLEQVAVLRRFTAALRASLAKLS